VKSTSSARKVRIRRLALVLVSIIGTWAFLGYLATIPVTGNHPYWRTFRFRPEDFGLQAENVSFLSQEGIPLKGWYIRPHGASHGAVIVAHGINGNRSDMLSRAAILVRHNYAALLIDLRDHGESGGHFTGPGYVESRDILGALKFLRSQGMSDPLLRWAIHTALSPHSMPPQTHAISPPWLPTVLSSPLKTWSAERQSCFHEIRNGRFGNASGFVWRVFAA